jgi:hypothetical protein
MTVHPVVAAPSNAQPTTLIKPLKQSRRTCTGTLLQNTAVRRLLALVLTTIVMALLVTVELISDPAMASGLAEKISEALTPPSDRPQYEPLEGREWRCFFNTSIDAPPTGLNASMISQRQAMTVKFMSFNVRYGTARDRVNRWAFRRDILFDSIKADPPDILGTQEVCVRCEIMNIDVRDWSFSWKRF